MMILLSTRRPAPPANATTQSNVLVPRTKTALPLSLASSRARSVRGFRLRVVTWPAGRRSMVLPKLRPTTVLAVMLTLAIIIGYIYHVNYAFQLRMRNGWHRIHGWVSEDTRLR